MRLIEIIKSAFASIFSRKVRSFLTSLGVIIGVFAVASLLSVGEASIAEMNESMSELNGNVIEVDIMDEKVAVSVDDVKLLQEADSVAASAPVANTRANASNGISEMQVAIRCTTEGYDRIKDYCIENGRFILPLDVEKKTDAVVLGQTVALKLFGHTDIIGKQIMMGDRAYTVVGVLAHTDQSLGENANEEVFIPISTAQTLFDVGKIMQFEVLASTADDIDTAKAKVRQLMGEKTSDADNYYINSSDDLNEYIDESNKTMMALFGGIGGISLLVSGIGIMNIMLVSVRERTREIGIRKAVGAKRRDILTQFLVEAVTLSVLGGILGIALTFAVAAPIGSLFELTISPSVSIITLSIIFSVTVGVVFGVYPAIKASKLRPVQALHYE